MAARATMEFSANKMRHGLRALDGVGAGLILLMIADVFHTLLYPHGSGPVCRTAMRGFWLLSGSLIGRASTIAVPLAMAAVIGACAGLAVMGWALLRCLKGDAECQNNG